MERLNKIIEIVPIMGLFFIFITVLLQVVFRSLFFFPLSWSDEAARISHLWIVFIGAYLALTMDQHVKVDYFMSFLPKKLQPWLEMFINLIERKELSPRSFAPS